MFFRKKHSVSSAPEYIVVGLGNPGNKYEGTRHNVGFMCVDLLADKYKTKVSRLKWKSLYGDCIISGKRCLLVKPQNFMNRSGESVRDIADFYKIPAENVVIVFDDVALPVGKLRIRLKGSDGGHNGMKNIIYLTGKDDYPRVRIGVGEKPHPDYDLADWVLSRFGKDEYTPIRDALDRSVEAIELLIDGQADKAMRLFN